MEALFQTRRATWPLMSFATRSLLCRNPDGWPIKPREWVRTPWSKPGEWVGSFRRLPKEGLKLPASRSAKRIEVFVVPTSAKAVRRCGLGAVIAAAFQLTQNYDPAYALVHNALRPYCSLSTLVHVNDVRSHAAIIALFDEVISSS